MVPFSNPPLGADFSSEDLEMFSSLQKRYAKASKAVGFVIHLGAILLETGFKEIREKQYPFVKASLQGLCHPRVLTGLAIVLWFTSKVRFIAS